MSIWPYEESSPLFTLVQELDAIMRHIEAYHYFHDRLHLAPSYLTQVMTVEWQTYIELERRLNDGLIWC